MKLMILVCLLGTVACLTTGCQTSGQPTGQRPTGQGDKQIEEKLRSMEQMMWRMDHKLDEINQKLDRR